MSLLEVLALVFVVFYIAEQCFTYVFQIHLHKKHCKMFADADSVKNLSKSFGDLVKAHNSLSENFSKHCHPVPPASEDKAAH